MRLPVTSRLDQDQTRTASHYRPREGGGDGEGSGEGEGAARVLQPLTSSQSIHFNSHENVAIFFYPSAFYFKNIQTMQNIG